MAEVTITSGRIKLIKDLPVGDDLTGTEAYAMLQNNVTKQSTILDIGRYTKSLDYATWVYNNSGTSSYVSSASASLVLKDPFQSNATTQYLESNLIVAGSITALGSTSLATVSVQSASSFRIDNKDKTAIALIVNQISASPGVTRMRDNNNPAFFVGPVVNSLGNIVSGGIVGIRTETPNKTLTVNGEISATTHISTSGNLYGNLIFGDGRNLRNIDGSQIQAGTITGDKLTGTINISAIPTNSILYTRISENASIFGYQLASDAGITAQQIATYGTNNINGKDIFSNGIASNQLAPNAGILGSQLATNAEISGSQIAPLTITNSNISNTTIVSEKLSVGAPRWTSNGNLSAFNDTIIYGSLVLQGDPSTSGNLALSGNIFTNANKGLYTRNAANTLFSPVLIYDTSSNAVKIHNVGSGTSGTVRITSSGGNATLVEFDSSGGVTATGDVTAFSDERLKKNIKTLKNSLEKVNDLRGVEFERIDTGEKKIGLIAQEVEEIVPEVVKQGEEYKSISYGNLVALLVEAVKELTNEVNSLKQQINKDV
jgi:hypothetical protein